MRMQTAGGVMALALTLSLAACAGAGAQHPAPREGWLAADDGVRLHWRTAGHGHDTVVVVHGGPGLGMETLAPDLAPLARGRTLLFYDQRSAGRSDAVADTARLAAAFHVADLEALRRRFGLSRLTLLGNSWGAAIIALYAESHPRRVERILLISPWPPRRSPDFGEYVANVLARVGPEGAARMQEAGARLSASADPVPACRAYFAALFPGLLRDPTDTARLGADPCAGSVENTRGVMALNSPQFNSLGDWDWRPGLVGLRAPVLIVHGEDDPLPLHSAQAWADALPQGALLTVRGAGHFPHVERADEVLPALDEFLRGVWPRGAHLRGGAR